MKDKHIINLLEENGLKDLSDTDIRLVEAHVERCAECRREYEAAKVSSILLKTRAAQTLEPPPFFETRVLSAWRERQAAAAKPIVDKIRQMWQDTKILVTGLATSVAMLAVLAFIVSQMTNAPVFQASADDNYSVESVVFDRQESPADDLNDDQLLQEIYESDDLEN